MTSYCMLPQSSDSESTGRDGVSPFGGEPIEVVGKFDCTNVIKYLEHCVHVPYQGMIQFSQWP